MLELIVSDKNIFSTKYSITSDIYFLCDNICFPSDDWTDFATIIINWWLQELIDNFNARKVSFPLFFMDGPYYLDCYKKEEKLQIDFIDDHNNRKVVMSCEVEYKEFSKAIRSASIKLIKIMKKNNINFKEEISLVELNRKLKICLDKARSIF